jgi:hypothetical protein
MIMVPHQTIRITNPTEPFDDVPENCEKRSAILIVFVDWPLAVT